MLIYGLVHADAPAEGLATADQEIFTSLVDRGTFDEYATFDSTGDPDGVRSRWGSYPGVVPADSQHGRAMIDRGWAATVDEYHTAFAAVQAFLDDHPVEHFWEDGPAHRAAHAAFHAIGEYDGPHTYLYDDAGDGIRDRDHLDLVRTSYAALADEDTENPYAAQKLYVVPAEVRY